MRRKAFWAPGSAIAFSASRGELILTDIDRSPPFTVEDRPKSSNKLFMLVFF
jgi:hypothetical protein